MSDLIDDATEGANAPEFTVSELSGAIKRLIEGEFTHVRVKGEIGRVSRPASGHLYFDLKDDGAVLNAVSWKGQARRLAVQPEEGMEVVAIGRLTTFPGQSRYQLIVEELSVAGVGALMAMLEKRRKALAAEGLFDAERKRPLPYLPEVIGVITSPTGAVIRDILHRLSDRFPRRVLIWPVVVQGEKSAPEVAAAIRGFNALTPGGPIPRPDVLIVARGGGSIEDLWGFNEEIVVRAVAAGTIPLISAVGHETDTTLIDFVADRRAPTPTAAAEMAVPVRAELLASLAGLEQRRHQSLLRLLDQRRTRLRDLARALPRGEALLGERVQRLDALGPRLGRALAGFAATKRGELIRGLRGFGPLMLRGLLDRRRSELSGLRLRPEAMARQVAEARRGLDRATGDLARLARQQLAQFSDRLAGLERMRGTLGYQATLARGFAVVRAGGQVVTRQVEAAKSPALEIEFQDGRLDVAPTGPIAPARKRQPAPPKGGQGTLF